MQPFPLLSLRRSLIVAFVLLVGWPLLATAQPMDRVRFGEQELFLSGGNVAWVNFARDIGPGATNLDAFDEIFRQVHANGGNSMRLWLHTTGAVSPAWSGDEVTGPGEGTIEDLRAILDLAWKHEVGLMLCLWSFDMLRISNGTRITDRAYALLTDPEKTQTYIDNALVPMVEALADHPAAVAWEIFNEPEGMSNEFGWSMNRHVPMADIQRFINRSAGAIHRAAPGAQVTNGSWSFHALWDRPPAKATPRPARSLGAAEVARTQEALTARYGHAFTAAEVRDYIARIEAGPDLNYYTNARLIEAGGDADGTLDFYTVHYYEWAGTALSPFHHPASYWGLDKPLVVAEFFMGSGSDGNPGSVYGIPHGELYETLYDQGYAGSLAWQWYNYPKSAEGVTNWPRMLAGMDSVYTHHPEAVDVFAGFRITAFTAEPAGIEQDGTSTLSWIVSGASSITIDGEAVDSVGTRTVTPEATTTYTLIAEERGGARSDTAHVTLTVLDPDEVNRARLRPAAASTVETCCGEDRDAAFAFDGDPNTRWSSEWKDGFADADADDEWIYVELEQAFDIHRIVLQWEAAYAASYDVQVSYDARVWTTVHEARAGDGGVDEIVFDAPPSAVYVRMRGLGRATEWGYSLWEFEVYGLPSTRQPPTVAVARPGEGAVLAPGSDVTLTATAADPDGSAVQVAYYIDGELLGTATDAPFAVTWSVVPAGEHVITAVATDNDGIAVSSAPHPVYVLSTDGFARYEAENAAISGDVTEQSSTRASGRAYLDMRDSGTITFDVTVAEAGIYLLAFGYNLAYDVPKHQNLIVNGEPFGEVRFNGAGEAWLERAVRVPLQAGANTIVIEKVWGWMYFDYLSVSGEAVNVAIEEPGGVPSTFALGQNYPNPFNPETVIAYTLPTTAHVRLDVFDAMGRRVATLIDGVQAAGTHTARFSAPSLASGIYLYRLEAGTAIQTKRMVLLR